MGVDIFAHLFLEERAGATWAPVKLVRGRAKGWSAATLAPGVGELGLPYDELGDHGYAALADLAMAHFGLKRRRPRRSRGLPKDISPPVRELFQEAREDAIASLEDLAEEYADDISIGEGWIAAKELAHVDWDGRWPRSGETYRELLGATFFAQVARVEELSATRELRIVFWFTT